MCHFGLILDAAHLFLRPHPSFRVHLMRTRRGTSGSIFCFEFRVSRGDPILDGMWERHLTERGLFGARSGVGFTVIMISIAYYGPLLLSVHFLRITELVRPFTLR